MSKNKFTSGEIKALLLKKYSPPSHAFFTEVADSTGMYGSRYADALAMSLWPSHGFELQGFEIKVSRSDFLNEIKQPEKANAVMQYCNKWWIVCPKGIALPDELPKPWGLMEVVGSRFYIKKRAPQLEPADWNKGFIASMLRRATESTVPKSTLHAMQKEMNESAEKRIIEKIEGKDRRIQKLEERIEAFEKASGMKIDGWKYTPEDLGNLVNDLLSGNFKRINVDYPIKLIEEAKIKLENYNRIAIQIETNLPGNQ